MVTSERKKLMVVGDGDCGKSNLLTVFTKNQVLCMSAPTVMETYMADLNVDGTLIHFELNDNGGYEEYDRLRPLQYLNTDVVLICFSVVQPETFANVLSKWVHEVKHFCPGKPIILVGTKSELRNDATVLENLRTGKQTPVTLIQAEEVAKKIGAVRYIESSAFTNTNVKETFYAAGKAVLAFEEAGRKKKAGRKTRCLLM